MTKDLETVYFSLSVDCEATQPAVDNRELGERSVHGLAEILENQGWRGTFFAIPTDVEASAGLYRELRGTGHEVGLHLHPAAQGYEEFCGIYGPDMQEKIIAEASDRFAQVMGYRPQAFCMGYASANDYTYPTLTKLGFRHGMCSMPGRILPECASIWAGASLFMHYAHAFNRLLAGDLDFVEIPATVDWESRMWGGKHPQDLRIELVDAKNHFYTIRKSLRRQLDERVPAKLVHPFTHNLFEFACPSDFRRQTLDGVIGHTKTIAADLALNVEGATLERVASQYRQRVELNKPQLTLDRRGHGN